MKFVNNKRLLQAAIFLGGIIPISAGLGGVILGPRMIVPVDPQTVSSIILDSHFRYLSGLLLAIGFGFWSTIPGVEFKSDRFRFLTMIVVIGGLGRLLSLARVGYPDVPMQLALGMELVITPLLAIWQFRLSRHLAK